MQFKNNTPVFTTDGKEIGKIDRVVIDPRTKKITHVVVRKGMVFTEDKVVPVELITEAGQNRMVIRDHDFDSLPDFKEHHYISLEGEDLPAIYSPDHAMPVYWYPYGGRDFHHFMLSPLPYNVEIEQNIPGNTVAVKEGARVMSADGEYVGDIERVFVNPNTDRAVTFLVSKGLILKERMLVPSTWVARFDEREVELFVGSELLKKQSELVDTWEELEELQADLQAMHQ